MTPFKPQRHISRRRFLQIAALAGGGALAGFSGSLIWANEAVRQFENEMIIPLTSWFVNTYLIRGGSPGLVDTGFPTDAAAIRQALAAHNLQPQDLSLIFITHGHYDHFGSAADLQSGNSVPVSIHALEAERLIAGVATPVEVLTKTGSLISLIPHGESPAAPVTPTVLFTGSERLSDYGLNARVIHTPGHTDGSLSMLIDGIAIIGDLLEGHLFYPNMPDYPFFIDERSDKPRIISSLESLIDAGADVFFPGHGLPFDRTVALGWLAQQ